MTEEIRVNRPVMRPESSEGQEYSSRHSGGSKQPWILVAVVVIVLVVLGVLFRDKLFGKDTDGAMKGSDYQAVFLSNGQVYFGKMTANGGDYITMEDIYYLQVVQQPGLQGSAEGQAQQQQQNQLTLVKLGNELHGPVDEMRINKEHILFYEEMKEDGKVMQAIAEHKRTGGQGTQAPTGQQATPPATQQQQNPTGAQQGR